MLAYQYNDVLACKYNDLLAYKYNDLLACKYSVRAFTGQQQLVCPHKHFPAAFRIAHKVYHKRQHHNIVASGGVFFLEWQFEEIAFVH